MVENILVFKFAMSKGYHMGEECGVLINVYANIFYS